MHRQHLYYSFIILLTAYLTLSSQHVFGHGEGGGQDKIVGDYHIELHYDVQYFNAGDPVQFSFVLEDSKSHEPKKYTSAFVKIAPETGVVFAATLQPSSFDNNASLLYAFPKGGSYQLQVRFDQGDNTLVETSFPITSGGLTTTTGKRFDSKSITIGLFLGLLVGAAAVFLLKRT